MGWAGQAEVAWEQEANQGHHEHGSSLTEARQRQPGKGDEKRCL